MTRHAQNAPTPIRFAHAVLRTRPEHFQKLVDFWLAIMNGRVVHGDAMACFLTFDEEHHRLAIIAQPDLEPATPKSSGLDHLAFTFNTIDDLIATYRRLKSEDMAPVWCINHGPTLSLYYADPDGNKAELQIDLFETADETTEFLRTSDFAANPVGIKFDPEDLFARYEAGEPFDTLKQRRTLRDGETMFDHFPG